MKSGSVSFTVSIFEVWANSIQWTLLSAHVGMLYTSMYRSIGYLVFTKNIKCLLCHKKWWWMNQWKIIWGNSLCHELESMSSTSAPSSLLTRALLWCLNFHFCWGRGYLAVPSVVPDCYWWSGIWSIGSPPVNSGWELGPLQSVNWVAHPSLEDSSSEKTFHPLFS